MECPVCMDPYDLERRRPKVLVPCGHSVCLACLLDPGFGKLCPQDRKPFEGEPGQLPDSMIAINIIAQGASTPRPYPWCRDCRADYTDHCADEGHASCSRKKMRSEQVVPLVQALQRGVAASAAFGGHLEAFYQDMAVARLRFDDDHLQLDEALAKLQVAAEDHTGLKLAMDAAELLLPRVEQLQESASLAGLRGRCGLAVQAEDGAEWRASVALEDDRQRALRHALLELYNDGQLIKVDRGALAAQAASAAAEALSLDLGDTRNGDMCSQVLELVLRQGSLAQVHSMTGVDCYQAPKFCLLLLQAVASHVQKLGMLNPQKQHLEALRSMPMLRTLSLATLRGFVAEISHFPAGLQELCIKPATLETMLLVQDLKALRKLDVECETFAPDFPDLPMQIEELALARCSKPHLLSIQRMPGLKRLFLDGLGTGLMDFRFSPLPSVHCGLSWLRAATPFEVPLLSLVRAHAATLQEIQLFHSSLEGCHPYVKGLPDFFRHCVFSNLQRLALLRQHYHWWTPNHTAKSCRQQVDELKDALRCTNSAVVVVCDICDKDVQL